MVSWAKNQVLGLERSVGHSLRHCTLNCMHGQGRAGRKHGVVTKQQWQTHDDSGSTNFDNSHYVPTRQPSTQRESRPLIISFDEEIRHYANPIIYNPQGNVGSKPLKAWRKQMVCLNGEKGIQLLTWNLNSWSIPNVLCQVCSSLLEMHSCVGDILGPESIIAMILFLDHSPRSWWGNPQPTTCIIDDLYDPLIGPKHRSRARWVRNKGLNWIETKIMLCELWLWAAFKFHLMGMHRRIGKCREAFWQGWG